MTDGDSSPCPLDRIVASNCFGGARDTVHWPTQIWSLSSLEGPTWTWTGYLRFQACEPLFPRHDHEVSRVSDLLYIRFRGNKLVDFLFRYCDAGIMLRSNYDFGGFTIEFEIWNY